MNAQGQLQLIRRGVEQVVPEEELVARLEQSQKTGKPLRVKYGIDPTGIDVHLGHTVPLRKLRQFQQLGHTAVVIIGDYTALVGDPSGRDETRSRLTEQDVAKNAEDYLHQIEKLLDMNKAEVHRNGAWFGKMSFQQVIGLCSHMTISQMLERDDFKKRIKTESAIYLHECLYPLMQGWDSVEVKADIELGGSEQLFSLMVARELQKDCGQTPQVAITLPILVGTDGARRMGKSLQNYIGISDPPDDMFGKLMSLPDACMKMYFELLTDHLESEITRLLQPSAHPRETKETLARDIVSQYHGAKAADAAAEEFRRRFTAKQDPTDIPSALVAAAELKDGKIWIAKLLKLAELAKSTSEARRLVSQGAVSVGEDRTKISDPGADIEISDGMIVRVGARRIAQIKLG